MAQRFSKQRELIYQTLCETRVHPTAEMLYQWLKPGHPELSLATVYRNLSLMASEGRVRRLSFPVDRYDARVERHPHLRCKTCGGVRDIVLGGGEPKAEQSEHEIHDCEILFHGICQTCIDAEKNEEKEKFRNGTDSISL